MKSRNLKMSAKFGVWWALQMGRLWIRWGLLGNDGLGNTRCGGEKRCYTSHFTGVQAKKGGQGWRGLIQPRTPSSPPWVGYLKIQSDTARSASGMNEHEFKLCCSQPSCSTTPDSKSFTTRNKPRGTNVSFNPRLRHFTAALIHQLYQEARSAVFQTSNFLWNRCEKQREPSDAAFCLTVRAEPVSHRSLPPVTLMFIFLPAHLDLTNSSLFSSWHHTSLRDARDGDCTEPKSVFSLHQIPALNSGWGIWP